jgi:2-oxoglutarate ferredoxin oxidoreductase subunit gamma
MKMSDRRVTEIRLSGSGGQGLVLAGIVLANAAVYDRKRVTQTQSYGPESRGGASRADVILSKDEIFFPEATRFDILLALTQEACDKFLFDLKDDGFLIVDNSIVKNIALVSSTVYELPFTEIALKKLGSPLPTNILSLSFLIKISGIVSESALKKAIESTVKKSFVDINLKAMKLGFDLAKKYKHHDRK